MPGQTVHQQESYTDRMTAVVFRPYTTLPPPRERAAIHGAARRPWIEALPDALAGLLRQFRAQALDLGKLGFDDAERYQKYRKQIFDTHDRLLEQLRSWLAFYGVTDADGVTDPDLVDLLEEEL